MKVVFIEGPGKQESVQKYLGSEYKVIPTLGHVRDLPARGLGVDIANNFKPEYVVMPDKQKTVAKIISEAKKADGVLLATDPDREGEAIAWHVSKILGLSENEPCRIVFNEISKSAITKGLGEARPIDINLVDAQQARRVLDRLVGYKLSPLLCKKIQKNLSAGRVQSVTLRLLVDREREIENFKPEEYWTLTATLNKEGAKQKVSCYLADGKDKKIKTKQDMDKIVSAVKDEKFVATMVKKSVTSSHPSAPFTTSTMQQDALNKLGMSLKTTTQTAQGLYEGVDVEGEGKVALVTYIRTDSVRISPEAQAKAKDYIIEKYGEKYIPEKPRFYKNKKDAQDAHEAIRPITLERTPESLKDKIGKPFYKLYKLIYDRFLASQMADATYNSLSVEFDSAGYKFKTTGRAPIFDGYTVVYSNFVEEGEDEVNTKLPDINENESFDCKELLPEQKYTKAPARYTEASLVKTMEEKGIGRPATYTQTVSVIMSRNYAEKEGKALKATELGKRVVDMLIKFFPNIMNIGFTAEMEDKLDDIEYGGKVWQNVVGEFYTGFEKELNVAQKDNHVDKVPDEPSDEVCEKCGSKMVIKTGKFGKFLACPNFPTCKNTRPIIEVKLVGVCPKCGKPLRELKTKAGKLFYGCTSYPDCDYKSWDIPSPEKCPKCGADMIEKHYKSYHLTKCTKCDFSRKDEIKKKEATDKSEE